MYTKQTLVEFQSKSDAAIKKMEAAVATLNGVIDKAENDSRTREWVIATVNAARAAALPALAEQLKVITELASTSGAVKKFWESKPLLLSIQTFDLDLAKDAQIRMGYATDLTRSPLAMLQAIFDNAKFDKALALVYQCWLAGVGRSNEAGFADACNMALDGIEIPGQALALAAIATCLSNRSHAETMAAVASGLRNDPIRKMNVARQQQVSSQMVEAAALEAQSD